MDLEVSLCENNHRLPWELVSTEEPKCCGHILKNFLNALACWSSLLSLSDQDTIVVIKEKHLGNFLIQKKVERTPNRG